MSKLLEGLNPSQREAVTHTIDPLLIIAGPGSGKTRTVVHSIAYAIKNLGVVPDRIVAFTFTRKAAGELKDRVSEVVGENLTNDIWISTFHSFCGSVLRKDIEKLGIGYTRNFKTLEEIDQWKRVRELTSIYNKRTRSQIDYIQHHEFANTEEILNFIKQCKARDIPPSDAKDYIPSPQMARAYADIYQKYEQRLRTEGAIDYESLQLFTDALFREVPEVKEKWQNKFELIFVDEYQDTDPVQYQVVKSLAEPHQNLRVVGDDDQGIYGWRGADIQNILNFEKDYPNAKVISLGQNYRSTQKIVAASRALADFNPDRRDKELFTRNCEGSTVKYFHCEDREGEASTISDFIGRAIQEGRNPGDFAVLYRTNKQARTFEESLANSNIPYYNLNKSEKRFSEQPEDAVSLMTIHKSKGLEFPNVFVVGICQELLPHYYNRNEKDWDEEIRLLYVAMTRSKNWLCLSSYEKEGDYRRGQSPFLERQYIPSSLLESIETLNHTPIPPVPEEMIDPQEPSDYFESLPEKLLESNAIVLGIDPGVKNIGWSITQKLPDGYTVLDYGTQTTQGWGETLNQTADKINKLIASYSIDAIAIERLDGAKEDWFLYVAACVAEIQRLARYHQIAEVYLYTPQQVKYAATGNRNADKTEVKQGVKERCNLATVPKSDHSADAIAASLCYLRSYLNSSRFEGNKRKQERYEIGCDYLDKKQYETAIDTFKETINIDPVYTEAHCGLGRTYLVQNDLDRAETAAKTALRFAENNHPDSQKLLDAIEHYRSGCNSLNNSEWNMAIDKFRESINLEPIFTEAHCGLSRADFEIGNLEAAKNAAEEALRLRDEYPLALELLRNVKMKYYYKGKTCFFNEEYNQAIFEFQKAVEIDQDFKGAHRFAGEAYLNLGNLEKAEKGAKDALQIDQNYELAKELLEKTKQKHKEDGDNYRNRKAYAEALISYQHAIRIDDKYKEAYNNLGIVYRNMKEYDKAIRVYQKAINIDDKCQVTHNNLSIVYRKISEYAKAVNSLKRAIAIKPDYQTAYYNLARTYFEMENLQAASEAVLEALRLDANDQQTLKLLKDIQRAYLKHGRDYFIRGDLAAAGLSAWTALELVSNDQSAHNLLNDIKQTYYKQGLACIENDMYTEAISVFQKAIEIDLAFKEAHYSLGEAYLKSGNLEKAEKSAREALRIDPNYERPSYLLASIKEEYYQRGLASLEQKEWKAAEKFAEEVLRIDPNYELASGLLKQTYYEQGLAHIENDRYVEGINKLQKAKDIDPNCEKTHYHLGLAYFKLNRLAEAQMIAEEALSIQPNYPQARELLSEINAPRNWLRLGRAKVQHLVNRIVKRIGF